MTVSIFIRSYRSDRFWLDYCLRSVAKFAKGFAETVVALPIGDESHFERTEFHGARVVWVQDPNCHPYIGQQVCKIEADSHCKGQKILYLDSDCFLTAKMTPKMFFQGAKTIMLLRHWSVLSDNAKQWHQITRDIMGYEPLFESMACHPMIYDRSTLAMFREHIHHTHKMPLREFVSTIQANRMSEFNALGSFAHRFHPYLYDFRIADPATDGYFRGLIQEWSYQEGGVDKHREKYERILAK